LNGFTKAYLFTAIKLILQVICLYITWGVLWFYVPETLTPTPLTEFGVLYWVVGIAPYIFVTLLFLQRPVALVGRLIKYLDRKIVFRGYSIYRIISSPLAVIPTLIILVFLPSIIEAGQDPIVAWYFDGHWFSWFALSLVLFRYGYKDIVKGLFAIAFVYGIHETDWFIGTVTQFSSPIYTGESFSAGFFGVMRTVFFSYIPLMITIITILAAYFIAWRVFTWKREIAMLAVPAIWGVIAIATNFPDTIALGVTTTYYTNPWVNLAEVLSWVIPVAIAIAPNHPKEFILSLQERFREEKPVESTITITNT